MVHALGRRNECKIYLIENAPLEQKFVGNALKSISGVKLYLIFWGLQSVGTILN